MQVQFHTHIPNHCSGPQVGRRDDATSVVGHAPPSLSLLLPLRLVSFSSGRGRGRMDRSCSYSLLVRLSLFEIVLLENNWRVFCHNKSLIRSLSHSYSFAFSFLRIGREGKTERKRKEDDMTRGAWHALLFSRNRKSHQRSTVAVCLNLKARQGQNKPKGPRLGKTDPTNHTIT